VLNLNVSEKLCNRLAQLLEDNRPELVTRYQQVMREAMFNGRSTIRPNMLKKVASDEVAAFSDFLHQLQRDALERGVQLHQAGLSEQPLLRMGQVTRQFFVKHLEKDEIPPTLELIDTYQEQVVQGFVQSLETAVFNIQERTRHAFERVVNRDRP
jgi:hypothetical protein